MDEALKLQAQQWLNNRRQLINSYSKDPLPEEPVFRIMGKLIHPHFLEEPLKTAVLTLQQSSETSPRSKTRD